MNIAGLEQAGHILVEQGQLEVVDVATVGIGVTQHTDKVCAQVPDRVLKVLGVKAYHGQDVDDLCAKKYFLGRLPKRIHDFSLERKDLLIPGVTSLAAVVNYYAVGDKVLVFIPMSSGSLIRHVVYRYRLVKLNSLDRRDCPHFHRG